MYAILKHGGHQYRVAPGDRLLVDRLTAGVGSQVTLEPVLLVADGDAIADIGTGAVSGAHVLATVVAHRRGRKLRVFTYKPKKRRRRTLGYRSQLTELLVDEVAPGGGKPASRRTERPATAAGTSAAAAEVSESQAEAKPRSRRAAAAAVAEDNTAVADNGPVAATAATPEPEAAPVTEGDETGAGPSAAAEARPAKRAARPRKKADGA